jgi:hypothetical protein
MQENNHLPPDSSAYKCHGDDLLSPYKWKQYKFGAEIRPALIEIMEKEGVVGPLDGVKSREVLAHSYDNMS